MRIVAIIILVMTMGSCNHRTQIDSIAVTLMSDRTDTIIPSPKLGIVEEIVDLETEPNTQIVFRFQNVGNTDYNSTYKATLGGHNMMDNQLIRQSEARKYFNKIDTLILKENSRKYHYNNSSIITPLLYQLTTLKNERANEKIAVLWSDLGEISDVYNILIYKNRTMVLKEPGQVAKHLKDQLHVPDLNGIKLYIVHFPKTREQNRMFRGMCMVYEEFFKDSGLEIHIGLDQELKL